MPEVKSVDPLYQEAVNVAKEVGYVGVANLQRTMKIGYTRAARLVDLMIERGFCEADPDLSTGRRAIVDTGNVVV